MITKIRDSWDLAAVLNAPPLTLGDAAETPLDWPGIMLGIGGEEYELDLDIATETFAALKKGMAAVRFYPRGVHCEAHRRAIDSYPAHWCPADREVTSWDDCDAEVTRDWRQVYVGQAAYAEMKVYPTLEEAKAAYEREVAEMSRICDQMAEMAEPIPVMSAPMPVQTIMGMLEDAGADITHAEFLTNPNDDNLEIVLTTGAFIVVGETAVIQHGVTYSYYMATLYETREDIGRSAGQLIWDGARDGAIPLIDAIFSYFPQVENAQEKEGGQ